MSNKISIISARIQDLLAEIKNINNEENKSCMDVTFFRISAIECRKEKESIEKEIIILELETTLLRHKLDEAYNQICIALQTY